MKRNLMFAGIVAMLATALWTPAKADPYVDPPSFGRIVYGMTGGAVVLPQEAWEGAYPDGSGTSALPGDAAFGGGPVATIGQIRYAGDLFGVPGANFGYDFAGVGGLGAVNSTAVATVFGTGTKPTADLLTLKLGFVSNQGWESAVSVYPTPSVSPLVPLFGTHTQAGAVSGVSVGDPFAFNYSSALYGFSYYSDNPANNTGTAANQLYNHMRAYTSSALPGIYFIGFEDVNFDTPGNPGYRRFDYNDTVIAMEFNEVPEPAFFQMAGLLGLGAFGLLRMRKRAD